MSVIYEEGNKHSGLYMLIVLKGYRTRWNVALSVSCFNERMVGIVALNGLRQE